MFANKKSVKRIIWLFASLTLSTLTFAVGLELLTPEKETVPLKVVETLLGIKISIPKSYARTYPFVGVIDIVYCELSWTLS